MNNSQTESLRDSWALCSACHGCGVFMTINTCPACNGRGWIVEESREERELRELRERLVEGLNLIPGQGDWDLSFDSNGAGDLVAVAHREDFNVELCGESWSVAWDDLSAEEESIEECFADLREQVLGHCEAAMKLLRVAGGE